MTETQEWLEKGEAEREGRRRRLTDWGNLGIVGGEPEHLEGGLKAGWWAEEEVLPEGDRREQRAKDCEAVKGPEWVREEGSRSSLAGASLRVHPLPPRALIYF